MDGDARPPELKPLVTNGLAETPVAMLAGAVLSGNGITLITDSQGLITRVDCPLSEDVAGVAQVLPGIHVSALVSHEDNGFIAGLLAKLSRGARILLENVPVALGQETDAVVYLTVASSSWTAEDDPEVSWRFSIEERVTEIPGSAREHWLEQRVEALETGVEEHRRSAEHSRQRVQAELATNRGLSRSLEASRELCDHQAGVLQELDEELAIQQEREREAREVAAAAQQRVEATLQRIRLLSEVSRTVTESLDADTIIERFAQMIVPEVADTCVVSLLDEEQNILRHIEVASQQPTVAARVHREPECSVPGLPKDHPVAYVLANGNTVVFDDPVDLKRGAGVPGFGFLTDFGREGVRSCVMTPLRLREHVFGLLTLGYVSPQLEFEPPDVLHVEDLALRVSQALDNARLFKHAQEATQVRERYLSMVSHELRSPLTVVSGFGALLLRQLENPNADREKLVQLGREMSVGLERLALLTDNLLTSAALQGRPGAQQTSEVDLVALIKDVIRRMHAALKKQDKHRIVLQAPRELVGHWDGESIDRAITNLVSNALKYSPDGSEILVTVAEQDGFAEIRVTDTGIGMSEQEQSELFTPFVRSNAARSMATGTGLGLYITKEIIGQHAGDVQVTSTPGQGSTFTIRLPLDSTSAGGGT